MLGSPTIYKSTLKDISYDIWCKSNRRSLKFVNESFVLLLKTLLREKTYVTCAGVLPLVSKIKMYAPDSTNMSPISDDRM
jgi:hypothetical protein